MTGGRLRLGFLGTGWIGRHRMEAMLATGMAEATGICDPDPGCREAALALAPAAAACDDLDALLALDPDGLVVATPSAAHAAESIRALEAGCAVFCQKPLGRTAAEVAAVVEAAARADRLLGVDLSYRHSAAMRAIRPLVDSGALGDIFAADLVFHNAYGPDKPWFYDPALSGGGCAIDLGVHLVDLALWTLGFPAAGQVEAACFTHGRPTAPGEVEDYVVASFMAGDVHVRLACSWRLHAGREAVIEAAFHGTGGGAALRNVGGSFYDFTAERFDGTRAERLAGPPDAWGARSASAWVEALARSRRFDPDARHLVASAGVIDRIYGR